MLLEVKNICKRYGSLQANDNVNLQIKPSNIHALLGENGAGKSTLVNIIYGLVTKDSGQIYWQGEKVNIHSPAKARSIGIGIVFQHFAQFEVMTVLENIALGIDYRGDLSELAEQIEKISEHYRLAVHSEALIQELSAGERQRVEIIRCLLQNPKLLILDEPTSVLTFLETKHLFNTLEQLRDDGCSILFIGHKLDEIMQICEDATILRRGKFVARCDLANENVHSLANMMVGKELNITLPRSEQIEHSVVLQSSHPKKQENFKVTYDSLQLKSGCITGIAGISGNGQDDLMAMLAGEVKTAPETILFNGVPIGHLPSSERNRQRILFVPTERLGRSAIVQMSLLENALLGVADKDSFVSHGLLDTRALDDFSNKVIKEFSVKTNSNHDLAGSLSGGNLQKYIVGRTLLQHPKILLIANPTWGVDIQAAIFIREQLLALRDNGTAILLASEDLDEVFALCDEIAVMNNYHLTQATPIGQLDLEKVGVLMTE